MEGESRVTDERERESPLHLSVCTVCTFSVKRARHDLTCSMVISKLLFLFFFFLF